MAGWTYEQGGSRCTLPQRVDPYALIWDHPRGEAIDDGRRSELNRACAVNNQLDLQDLDAFLAMSKLAMQWTKEGELEEMSGGRYSMHGEWTVDVPVC